jgi:hypothetical protein
MQVADWEQGAENIPLEARDGRFVLKCNSGGEELTKLGCTAPLPEAAAAGWGLIVEPNSTYDYACSACLTTLKVERNQMPNIPTFGNAMKLQRAWNELTICVSLLRRSGKQPTG